MASTSEALLLQMLDILERMEKTYLLEVEEALVSSEMEEDSTATTTVETIVAVPDVDHHLDAALDASLHLVAVAETQIHLIAKPLVADDSTDCKVFEEVRIRPDVYIPQQQTVEDEDPVDLVTVELFTKHASGENLLPPDLAVAASAPVFVISCTDTLAPTRCSTKVPRLDVNGTAPVLVYTFSREFVVNSTNVAATSTTTSAVPVDSSSGMFTRKAPWPPPSSAFSQELRCFQTVVPCTQLHLDAVLDAQPQPASSSASTPASTPALSIGTSPCIGCATAYKGAATNCSREFLNGVATFCSVHLVSEDFIFDPGVEVKVSSTISAVHIDSSFSMSAMCSMGDLDDNSSCGDVVAAFLLFGDKAKEVPTPSSTSMFREMFQRHDAFYNSGFVVVRPAPWPSFNTVSSVSRRNELRWIWKPPWPSLPQLPGNVNAQHNGWFGLGMWELYIGVLLANAVQQSSCSTLNQSTAIFWALVGAIYWCVGMDPDYESYTYARLLVIKSIGKWVRYNDCNQGAVLSIYAWLPPWSLMLMLQLRVSGVPGSSMGIHMVFCLRSATWDGTEKDEIAKAAMELENAGIKGGYTAEVSSCKYELLVIACSKEGTSIVYLTEKYPVMIIKVSINVFKGITDEDAANAADGLALKAADRELAMEKIKKLDKFFCKCEGTLLEDGQYYFKDMRNVCSVKGETEHYACMVDLFGWCDHLEKAVEIVKDMPMKLDVIFWGCIAGSLQDPWTCEDWQASK